MDWRYIVAILVIAFWVIVPITVECRAEKEKLKDAEKLQRNNGKKS